jgi:ATP-binding cassette, subfamily B, bacterial
MPHQNTNTKSLKNHLENVKDIAKASKRILIYAFKKAPLSFVGFGITVVLISITPFAHMWITSKIIDALVEEISKKGLYNQPFIYLIGIQLALYLISDLLNTLSAFCQMNLDFALSRELGHAITTKFSDLDLEHYENPKTNDLLQKVRENYNHRPQRFLDTSFRTISSIIRIISGISILISLSPILIMLLLLTATPDLINNIIFGKRNWGIWEAKGEVKRDFWASRYYLMSERSLMELRVFKTRPFLLKHVYNLFQNFQMEQLKNEKRRSLAQILLDIVSALGYGFVFVKIILSAIAGFITIGQFSLYVSTAGNLQRSFGDLFRRVARLYENGLYIIDIFTVLDLKEKITCGKVYLPEDGNAPTIRLKNVTFKYPDTKNSVIDRLNLTIKPGEHLAIVGENGAGKTTLIKLLMRFYDTTEGEITIDGANIKDLDLASWYTKVGTLFQEFNLYHFDAKTNISLGDPNKMADFYRIVEAAKKSQAHDFIEKYDKKYDQILSKQFSGGIRPSYGQWQKIALARAFFKDAPILILDEPTSAIDPKSEFEIFERLFEFAQGKTVIIISHRFSTVRNAKRIIVLDQGKIVEEGSHNKLLKIKGGKYSTAFELQREGYK